MPKITRPSTRAKKRYSFDVVLSFAGEDRAHVKKIAQLLQKRNISVFYDEFNQYDLWGKELYEHLDDIYTNKGRFCMMFLSEHYAKKLWTNHERKSAQARAFTENREYILPVRIDDTKIPGIRSTQGFLDLRKHSYDQVVEGVEHKLGRASVPGTAKGRTRKPPAIPKNPPLDPDILLHPIKKTFTQEEKDVFLDAALPSIKRYFQRGLAAYKAKDADVTGSVTTIDARSFICTIYVRGTQRSQCKIWLGEQYRSRAIYYSESRLQDNSWNDSLSVEDDGFELYLRPSGIRHLYGQPADNHMTANAAATYLWQGFIDQLAR
jgi:hypothetical protein